MSFLDSLGGTPGQDLDGESPRCSRKGCRHDGQWQILWNNPRLHTPERRKIWLACSEHRQWLEDYLGLRGFWRQTLPLDSVDSSGSRNNIPDTSRGTPGNGEGTTH
ncbi:hypothetical protein ODZ83_08755 [Acaricomes phytoseiuli]|uniref:hypothetical protein n=1 Tax=Acaricomes phytoseiuli TaxID=291968 RepID=UPI0022215C65|nr:hypothetical protein [Acaricomes phytoseiuli]MCW1250264.1 hypothetical protein [Acaricomes phytoseiuli]